MSCMRCKEGEVEEYRMAVPSTCVMALDYQQHKVVAS